jgi:hypothetical protein
MEDKLRRKDGGLWPLRACFTATFHPLGALLGAPAACRSWGSRGRWGRSQMYSHERSRVASAHRRLPWSAGIEGI